MNTTKKPIKLKSGAVLPKGCDLRWENGNAIVNDGDRDYKIGARTAARALDLRLPTFEDLERWTYDSVCESVLGETVEPDGYDEHGSPSWLIAYGLI